MWANAQRDGCHAEYRWRPLFPSRWALVHILVALYCKPNFSSRHNDDTNKHIISCHGGGLSLKMGMLSFPSPPSLYVFLPSNRHHQSNDDSLEGKRENYQVCYVQYCVQQLFTVQCTHIWTDLTVLWIEFCLTGPISLCLDSFFCVCIACMCRFVTWWGGPGGIEAYS